jgi:hypothetical protein
MALTAKSRVPAINCWLENGPASQMIARKAERAGKVG